MNETDNPNPDDPTMAAPPSAVESPQAPWPNPPAPEFRASEEQPGATLGRYKLLEKIGEGGFGVVYVAEQKEPVRRRVALKIIKLGMDTRSVVARFEAERQALAMMDHPNIAKVFDAGATDTGRPYFVMELVRGIRITDYCDQHKLSTSQRLELFIMVCHAIQHAHQKGIIHRDIKPSNILITLHDGVPVPKVIDFGIAKATQQDLTEKTIYTQLQQFIGTPAYMSPEQAEMSGLDIDTRSDIYSLGVLLYELLTGRTPFDGAELMSLGVDAMRKTIREKEPPKPSSKLATLLHEERSTTAARHAAEAPKLIRLLKGDLDWIAMKCLEKDRTRRYETANGLAVDIKRHLNNETIAARPPSSTYRFQKWARRNKLVFGASAAILLVLMLGITFSTWQAVRATHAQHEAQGAETKAVEAQAKAVEAQADETQQRKLAEAARASETKLREQAQADALAARRRAYASDMNAAKVACDENNLGRAIELINRQRDPGLSELRGWEWRYLWQRTRSDALYTLAEKFDDPESLAISSDGQLVARGMAGAGGVTLWDLRTRKELLRLSVASRRCRTAFSPTAPILAYTTFATLNLWNTATHQMVGQRQLDDECSGLAFSTDGKVLVSSAGGKQTGRITLWKMPEATPLASYQVSQPIHQLGTAFATSADAGMAAYTSLGQGAVVIDLHNGKDLCTVPSSKDDTLALALSPDGKILASGGGIGDSDIRLWEVATGKEIVKLQGHNSFINSLVFWPDGKKLASSSGDQTIRIWDVASHECLDLLHGHHNEVRRIALSPDNKTLVSCDKDGVVLVWDTSTNHSKQTRITIPQTIDSWTFTSDSQAILTLNRQGQVMRWTGPEFQQSELCLEIGKEYFSSITNSDTPNGQPWAVPFSHDGRLLATESADGGVSIWDVSKGVLSRRLTSSTGLMKPLMFLANGTKLATFSGGVYREWNLSTGQESLSLSFNVVASAVSSNGEHVVLSADGSRICVEDAASGQVTQNVSTFFGGNSTAISRDGKLVAIGSNLGYARVWNTSPWQEVATLGRFVVVHSVAFSDDGKRLATGAGRKDTLKLWDTTSWQELLTLEGEGATFLSTAFSPDGNTVGSMNRTGTLHLCAPPPGRKSTPRRPTRRRK